MRTNERVQILTLCGAQVLGMLGYAGFVAQLPELRSAWSLSLAQSGWIMGAFHGGYALTVPILLSATDVHSARKIYLTAAGASVAGALLFALSARGPWTAAGAQLLMGAGLAGTYMPGLRLLSERVRPAFQSRAITLYTACYALGTSASFLFVGQIGQLVGWRWTFGLAAIGPALSLLAIASLVGGATGMAPPRQEGIGRAPSRWRLVLQDRWVTARALAYAIHNFELFGLWSWVVAFLAFGQGQRPDDALRIDPTVIAAAVTLMLLPASLAGNELAERFGWRRSVVGIMSASALLASVLGVAATALPSWVLLALLLLHACLAAADSGALTSSVVRRADPALKGTTMAVYSTVGFAGAFAGPLVFGAVLQHFGAGTPQAWSAAFAVLGLGALLGPAVLVFYDPARPAPGSLHPDPAMRREP